MLATQIALYFDIKIVKLDPYGILKFLMPDRVIKVGLRDKINKNLEKKYLEINKIKKPA